MENGFLTQIAMPVILGIIMLGMGMSLVLDDFKRVLQYPRAVALGLFGQLLLLPVIGYICASIFPLTPELAVGVMILAACAGGATSNLIVYMARGDTALSVTLTAISSCITVITIPFVINFGLKEFMGAQSNVALPIGTTNLKLFLITLLPVMIGMFMRHNWPSLAIKLERHVSKISAVFFIAIVAGILIKNRSLIGAAMVQAGPVCFAMNAFTMTVGFVLALMFRLNPKQSVAISVEIGVQNSATGMFIATTLLNNPQMAITPAIYSLVMYMNAGLLIFIMSRRHRKVKAALGLQ